MRRNRRGGGGGGLEFGGSGEDSFVAVVVTKLTGALLFILLLTMVIMALLPKAVDVGSGAPRPEAEARPLKVVTPAQLPEAIAGRPYAVALAAEGGRGPLKWSLDGELPDGLAFDATTGLLKGTAKAGTPKPLELAARVTDGDAIAVGPLRLVVYQSDVPLATPAWWKPGIPPIPWRAWIDSGVGFLLLWLVHLVGMSAIAGLERQASAALAVEGGGVVRLGEASPALSPRRFALYRGLLRACTVATTAGLVVWLWSARP